VRGQLAAVGPDPAGLLILRNMLPAPSFSQAIQRATVGHEAATMGGYLPASHYYSKAGYEALGCAAPAATGPPSTAPRDRYASQAERPSTPPPSRAAPR